MSYDVLFFCTYRSVQDHDQFTQETDIGHIKNITWTAKQKILDPSNKSKLNMKACSVSVA